MSERRKPSHYVQPSMGLENGKVPPNAADLEEVILGAILLESECLIDVISILSAEDFYKIEHQYIYGVMVKLYEKESKIDVLTVTAECKKEGVLDMVGGPLYISQLTDRISSSANVEEHARYVKEASIKRELIRVCGEGYHQAFEDTSDVGDLSDSLAEGLEKIFGIFSNTSIPSNEKTIATIQKSIEKANELSGITGVTIGIREVDKIYRGRQKGDLIIKAGRPSMGKSSSALSEVLHIGIVLGLPVLFFSLEMGVESLMIKLISMLSGIPMQKMQRGDLTKEDWNLFHDAGAKISQSKIIIVDTVNDLNSIKGISMKQKTKHPDLAAIYIDYLQLVECVNQRGSMTNRQDDVSQVSRSFKKLARKLFLPVVALSQLSRAVETRGGSKKPMLSDLRESGSLEQDADIVEFLWRPEYYGIDNIDGYESTTGLAFLCIAKHRNGALKDVPMRWDYRKTQFTDWDERHETVPTQPYGSIDDLDDNEEDVF